MPLNLFKFIQATSWGLGATVLSAFAQTPAPPHINFNQLVRSQLPVDVTSPVTAEASFDPPLVRPGEISIYRVRFNALEASINWPSNITASSELQIQASAHAQMVKVYGGEFRPYTTFNYHVTATKTGTFSIPSFTVQVYGKAVAVPQAHLEVRMNLGHSHEPARRLVLETATTNAFVGESLNVRVLLPATAGKVVEMLTDVQFNGEGFMVDQSRARNSIQRVVLNGRAAPTYIHEEVITPIAVGNLVLSAQGFTAGRQFRGPVTITGPAIIPGGLFQSKLLDSDPVTINVRPLPAKGKLPGFTGAIGNFICSPPHISSETVRVGDPVQLTVSIRGEGDLDRLVPPPAPDTRSWQIFPANAGNSGSGARRPIGGASFSYTLIPITDKVKATPVIPFSYFDPKREAYVDLSIPSVPITVLPNGTLTKAEIPVESAAYSIASETKTGLSDLAKAPGLTVGSFVPLQLRSWFPFVQVFPALGFAGLWVWDRRRRFLELHPEIVRVSRARRRLRREKRLLRRAAADGDAAGFTRCAVNAMKIACAPRQAAEPRALVCGDVLQALNVAEREGRPGEIVRHFFATADASNFAVSPPRDGELLALKSELDELLMKLEEQL